MRSTEKFLLSFFVLLKIEEIKSVDFVCKLFGLIDAYKILVKTSLFVQNVSIYPWEYDDAIHDLKECLNSYAGLLEQLDSNTTQEINSIEGKTSFSIVEYTLALDHLSFYLRM